MDKTIEKVREKVNEMKEGEEKRFAFQKGDCEFVLTVRKKESDINAIIQGIKNMSDGEKKSFSIPRRRNRLYSHD